MAMNPIASSEAKHWGTLGTILWGLAIGVVFLVLQTIVLVGFAIRGSTQLSEQQREGLWGAVQYNGTAFSIATFVSGLGCVLLLLGIIKLKRGSVIREYLALNAAAVRTLGMWLGILAVFLALSDALTVALGRPVVPEVMTQLYASTRPVWLMWVALVVAAPIWEETFFRGFLFKGFSSGPLGPIGAIIAIAILWAAIHVQYDLYGIATVFFQGLLQGAARVTTRSLTVPVLMHAEANIVAGIETALLLHPVG